MKYLFSFLLRFIPRPLLQRVAHIGLRTLSVFYIGSKVKDPIDGRTYRKFLPYGRLHPRENALSPYSLSLERHRLMWLYLKEKTNFFTAPIKLLHIAPELCFIHRFEAMGNLDYITADIESPLAKVKMDIHSIPFEANTFDVVFCNHVLEHVDDDLKAMREMLRVLKPGGWGIIQVPLDYNRTSTYEDKSITAPRQRELVFGQNDHQRVYGTDYGSRLQLAGFKVTEDDWVKKMDPEMVRKYGLDPMEIIYRVDKI